MIRESNVPVIMYHCVNDDLKGSPHGFLGFSPPEFRAHLNWLSSSGYSFLTLSEFWRWLKKDSPNDIKPVVLTFDDGFRDNHDVVAPLMHEFGAKGTVFVNPDVTPEIGTDRASGSWGYLDRDDLITLSESGTLEIQSHSWDHLRVFTSPEVVDVYTRDHFDNYWWLVWLLRPETRKEWNGDIRRFADAVPEGYPIFRSGRHLAGPRFEPSPQFVERCISRFGTTGEASLGEYDGGGTMETAPEYRSRAQDSLSRSKTIIEQWTGAPVEHLCFPGGAYNSMLLELAGEAGYLTYMRSSRDPNTTNRGLASAVSRYSAGDVPLGVSRIAVSIDYPESLRSPWAARASLALKVRSWEGRRLERWLQGGARRIRDLLP